MTARLRRRRSLGESATGLFSADLSRYDRVASVFTVLDGLLPGISRWVCSRLLNLSGMPFRARQVELLDFGSGSTVFVLGESEPRLVVKVYRRSLGLCGRDLAQLAGHFKRKYETVASWYRGPHSPVPPSSVVVFQGPLLRRPAAAMVQAQIVGQKNDFFQGFTDEELARLAESPGFRAQLLFFAERTREIVQSRRRCPDILGKNNLMVVRNEGASRLALIDFGIFDLDELQATAPALCKQIEERLLRIDALRRRVLARVGHETAEAAGLA